VNVLHKGGGELHLELFLLFLLHERPLGLIRRRRCGCVQRQKGRRRPPVGRRGGGRGEAEGPLYLFLLRICFADGESTLDSIIMWHHRTQDHVLVALQSS
jgi:hypothetical protein